MLLVLAWPEVWRDADALEPHLIRARAGNYGLILVGTDAELEDGALDALPRDADLTALVAPISMVAAAAAAAHARRGDRDAHGRPRRSSSSSSARATRTTC